jgi:hypothetical protein
MRSVVAERIVQLLPAGPGFVNAYNGDDGFYTEAPPAFALVERGNFQEVVALECNDGAIQLASKNEAFVGTYHVADPDLRDLEARLRGEPSGKT